MESFIPSEGQFYSFLVCICAAVLGVALVSKV